MPVLAATLLHFLLFANQSGSIPDLLAIKTPVTAASWIEAHPQEVLQPETVEQPISVPFACAAAQTQISISGVTFTREAIFLPPEPINMHLATGNTIDRTLINQCLLNEIKTQNVTDASQELFQEWKANLEKTLGAPDPATRSTGDWNPRIEWTRSGTHYTLTYSQPKHALTYECVFTTSEKADLGSNDDVNQARALATRTKLPASEVQHMQELLTLAQKNRQQGDLTFSQQTPQTVAFLLQWVKASRVLPPDQRAAGLYSADVLLSLLPLEDEAIRTQLASEGAHATYFDPAASYRYSRDWMKQAFQAAPASPAGQQAFLMLLNGIFKSCSEGFEEVITRAPQYLQQNPQTPIKPDLLLDIAEAYSDRVATANGANGDPFQAAKKYKPTRQQDTNQAMSYYRAAIAAAAPGSRVDSEARSQLWSLIAGIPPLETHFVQLCD